MAERPRGRPKKYTKKYLEDLADEMVEYFRTNPDARFIVDFCAHKLISKQRITEFREANEYFSVQLGICKTICESRLASVLLDSNAQGAKFALSCQYDWADVTKIEQNTNLNLKGGFADAIKEIKGEN